uniref:Histone-lysine N-methyltransferase n=1 Tax=Globodera rostochiensis TaxID=31243 RepID=A0A914GWV8_GLORO
MWDSQNIIKKGERERQKKRTVEKKRESEIVHCYLKRKFWIRTLDFVRDGKSDEFHDETNDSKEDLHPLFDYPSKAVIAKIFDCYHNKRKRVLDILFELDLEPFDFLAALCNNVWTMENIAIDLTRAIKYRHITEYQLIFFVDLLANRSNITTALITLELAILPSDALLMLTLIWSELVKPAVARKFEPYLSSPSPTNITEGDYKRMDEHFQQMFNEQLQHCKLDPIPSERNWKMKLERDVCDFKKEFEGCSKIASRIAAELTEVHQSICKVPQLQVETVISDSTDSDENLDESNGEISMSMKKEDELHLEIGHFCFAPIEKLCKGNFELKSCNYGFIKCMLKRKLENGQYEVQMARVLAGSENIVATTHTLSRTELAVGNAPSVRCPEGTRVVALSELAERQADVRVVKYFSGTIGVKPFTQNRFEYLVFFDNGLDEYVRPEDIRILVDQPTDQSGKFQPRQAHTKLESTNPPKAKFLKQYFNAYPDWPLIQLKKLENTQRIMSIRNGVKESAFVLDVDRQLSLLRFPGANKIAWPMTKNGRDCAKLNCQEHLHIDEWLYRGNPDRFPTLAQAQDTSSRGKDVQNTSSWRHGSRFSTRKLPSSHFEMAFPQQNMSVYQSLDITLEAIRRQTAKKRSSKLRAISFEYIQMPTMDRNLIERKRLSEKVIEYSLSLPKNTICYLSDFHCEGNAQCSPLCVRNVKDVQLLQSVGKIHSPYFTPLLFGWHRMLIKIPKECNYLRETNQSQLTIDMFSFDPQVRPEVLSKPFNEKSIKLEDFTTGEEPMPISLANAIDDTEIGPNFIYRPRRTGIKRMSVDQQQQQEDIPCIVEESIDPCFCSGCSCTGDCADSKRCECRRLTAVAHERQLDDKIISGIYECNSLCKCSKRTCFNRVVQQDLKIPLQLFMTAEKGWGVRTLVDIPQGTFVCTYSGEILDENVAESQGKAISDIYLAELDLVKVVEGAKEEQGIDLISDEGIDEGSDENEDGILRSGKVESAALSTEDEAYCEPDSDHNFFGAFDDPPSAIDEEMANELVLRTEPLTNAWAKASKHNKLREQCPPKTSKVPPMKLDEFCQYFGEDFTYIIDAAKMGNIGRFLNHSCDPNCHVQHCLVDTHDLRMPWCAFFTKKFVRAGEELCWDYAYEIGSVERQVNCKCGTSVCRGRLL